MVNSLLKVTALSLIIFNLGCGVSPSKTEIAMERGKQLQELLKEESYSQIYRDSASCTRSNYSEDEFTSVLKEAIEKLKSIDANLEFLDYDYQEESFNNKWVTYQNYGIGYNEIEIVKDSNREKFLRPKDKNHAMILTAWQNDEDLKLTTFKILMNENGSSKWFGTSSCTKLKEKTSLKMG